MLAYFVTFQLTSISHDNGSVIRTMDKRGSIHTVNIGGAEVGGAFSWGPQVKFCLGPHKAWCRLCCIRVQVHVMFKEFRGKPALFIEMVCLNTVVCSSVSVLKHFKLNPMYSELSGISVKDALLT